ALEETMRTMRSRLARASQLATVAQLSASIAHEVNQPLAAVVANAGTCLRWLSTEPPNLQRARLMAERIVRDGTAAADGVNRVRALFNQSRSTGKPLNLNEIVSEVRDLLLVDHSGGDLVIEVDLDRDLPLILADRVQMQQVIFNLARNGLEAMETTDE